MRGIIKWKPFNTLINNYDIKEIEKKKLLIKKPIIMEDRISKINMCLIEAVKNNLNIEIKHFKECILKTDIGKINKINKNEKYILINNKRIYFKNIININIL